MEEGAGRAGARTARASSGCATRPTSPSTRRAATPGCRSPSSSPSRRRRPAIREDERAAARAHRHHGDQPARPARHRRRPGPEPRAHPALDHPRRRVARRGRTSTWPRSSRQIQTPPVAARRRARPGVVLSRPRSASRWRWRSTTCSPRRASARGWRASRSTSAACSTRRRASRASPSSPSRISATPSACSSSRCCSTRCWAGCARSPAPPACARSLYMDEIFGYFPPVANPPSKRPLLTLLKQARAFGVGVVLATQNPVDLDYKGLSNAGTWFIGRLQTERDKARVLDGLEGAAASAGSGFDRGRDGADPRRPRQPRLPDEQRPRGRARWSSRRAGRCPTCAAR